MTYNVFGGMLNLTQSIIWLRGILLMFWWMCWITGRWSVRVSTGSGSWRIIIPKCLAFSFTVLRSPSLQRQDDIPHYHHEWM